MLPFYTFADGPSRPPIVMSLILWKAVLVGLAGLVLDVMAIVLSIGSIIVRSRMTYQLPRRNEIMPISK